MVIFSRHDVEIVLPLFSSSVFIHHGLRDLFWWDEWNDGVKSAAGAGWASFLCWDYFHVENERGRK